MKLGQMSFFTLQGDLEVLRKSSFLYNHSLRKSMEALLSQQASLGLGVNIFPVSTFQASESWGASHV
jgi:hypothetical protein